MYIMQHVRSEATCWTSGDVVVTVCATVSTGLESVAVSECREKLDCKSMREGCKLTS